MHVVDLLRLSTVMLAVLFAAVACAAWSAGLAVVPGAPQSLTEPRALAPRPSATAVAASVPSREATRGNVGVKPAKPAKPAKLTKPEKTIVKLRPRPKAGPFEMNLYRKGDFMHQATKDMCVAGSTQTMMNIIDPGKPNRSEAFQKRLYERGRRLSPDPAKLGPIGVDLTGWAQLLNTGGYGPYVVESAETRRGAIRKAARALRLTNRPVGLVTWRGAHSWVMSGFTATADPAHDHRFGVTAVYIQDTWYPYVSTIWGASDPPNTLVPVARLKRDYLPYQRPRARYPKRDGKFMLILPVLPAGAVAR